MSSSLRQALLFVGVGLLIGAGLYALGRQYPAYYKHEMRIYNLLAQADEVEYLAAGHSQSRAIDFEAMDLPGYYLWRPGSDMYEVDYQLRALVPELPNLKAVFISISYASLFHNNGRIESTDVSEVRRVYYATTPTWRSWRPIDGDVKNLVKGKLAPVVRPDHWEAVVEDVLDVLRGRGSWLTNRAPEDTDGFLDDRRYDPWQPDSFLAVAGEWTADKHVRLAEEVETNDPRVAERTYALLADLTAFLEAHGVRAVFYTPPYSDIYNARYDELSPERRTTTVQLMERLAAETSALYVNRSTDPDFQHRYEWFHDDHHLNALGAAAFSQKLRTIVLEE